jgi:hypothetical protein
MLCNECKHRPICKTLCDAAERYTSQDTVFDTDFPHEYYDFSTDDPNDYEYHQDMVDKDPIDRQRG